MRVFLVLIAIILKISLFANCENERNSVQKPNIIIFIADDLGYGDLGCFGNTTLKTPNIDSLARDGVRLTHHIATASVCTPSRAALMTGRHQMRSGMAPSSYLRINLWIASRSGLPPSEITFAELTKEAGYRNALIGKWHLGHNKRTLGDNLNHPLNQGFDYFYGLLGTNFDDLADDGSRVVLKQRPHFNYQLLATVLAVTFGLILMKKRGFINVTMFILIFTVVSSICFYRYFVMNNFVLLNSMLHRNYDVVEQPIRHVGLSKRLVHEGLEFMRSKTAQSEPFLLVISFVHVHTALFVSKEFAGSSKHGIYGDAVQEMDWSVGRILDHLDETNQRNNTLVYFMSDHGAHKELGTHGGFNGIFKGGKAQGAPEGSIRVPGLFRWPGVLPSGKTIDVPISTMDIFPLVAQAAGVSVPKDRPIDGKDILNVLKGHVQKSPHEFMFHYCDDMIHAARYIPTSGDRVWKYVTHLPDYNPGTDTCRFGCVCRDAIKLDPPRLYDINADPFESSPIDSTSPLYKDITARIVKAIDEHKQSLVEQPENQFSLQNALWRYSLQECCNGTFPFNCGCQDSKFSPEMYE